MKKIVSLFMVCMLLLCGCGELMSNQSGKAFEFTVVSKNDIPAQLKGQIDLQKQNSFQLSLVDKDYLYIAVGYGEQDTGGYSIQVERLIEKGEDICVTTKLVGPKEDKIVRQRKSYPYIVVKTEAIDRNIVYE